MMTNPLGMSKVKHIFLGMVRILVLAEMGRILKHRARPCQLCTLMYRDEIASVCSVYEYRCILHVCV